MDMFFYEVVDNHHLLKHLNKCNGIISIAIMIWIVKKMVIKMQISARNMIEGTIKGIQKGEVASTVKIEISKPTTMTSMITKEAVEELGLKEGDKITVVIKASEILLLKE